MTLFDSLWDYFRQRTRNAVLAGLKDALDVVEQSDAGDREHEAAALLLSRLGKTDRPQLEHSPKKETTPGQGAQTQERREPGDVHEAIDSRLDAASVRKPEPPASPAPSENGQPAPFRRPRGRPRKDRST